MQHFALRMKDPEFHALQKLRLTQWRSEEVVKRLESKKNPSRAHTLGYKAKPGFIVVRTRIPKGGRKTPDPAGGRKPKSAGRFFTTGLSRQVIAEQRVADKFPNMEVLNSYFVGEDGIQKWYEVILVDSSHPAVKADKEVRWITQKQHTGRVYRGLTSQGKKARGLRNKGKGSEKVRPSIRAHDKMGK